MIEPGFSLYYIHRKREPEFHSIENVFEIIIGNLENQIAVKHHYVSHHRADPCSFLKNIRALPRRSMNPGDQTPLYHITGHVNYMALRTGRQSVLTVHDMGSALRGNPLSRVIKLILWFWIPVWLVKRVTLVSEASKKELIRKVPFARKKTVVVPNPVHPDFRYEKGSLQGSPPGPDGNPLGLDGPPRVRPGSFL